MTATPNPVTSQLAFHILSRDFHPHYPLIQVSQGLHHKSIRRHWCSVHVIKKVKLSHRINHLIRLRNKQSQNRANEIVQILTNAELGFELAYGSDPRTFSCKASGIQLLSFSAVCLSYFISQNSNYCFS